MAVADQRFAWNGGQEIGEIQIRMRELYRLVRLDPPVVDELETFQVDNLNKKRFNQR